MSSRLSLLLAILAGCSEGLDPPSLVNKLRVLAVRAQVPQPPTPANPNPPALSDANPGDTVLLDALVAGTDGDVDGGVVPMDVDYLWIACTPPPGSTSVRDCTGSAAAMAGFLPTCADEPSAGACLLGASAMVSYPTASTPVQTAQSVYVSVVVATKASGGSAACLERVGRQEAPGDSCVIALKTLTIQPFGAERNSNPAVSTFLIGSDDIHSTPGNLRLGQAFPVTPEFAQPETPTEVLTFSWFATEKDFDHFHSGDNPQPPHENPANTYTNQSNMPGRVHFWLVLRDDRGGVDWTDGFADFVMP